MRRSRCRPPRPLASSGPLANRVATGSTNHAAPKKASADTNRATKRRRDQRRAGHDPRPRPSIGLRYGTRRRSAAAYGSSDSRPIVHDRRRQRRQLGLAHRSASRSARTPRTWASAAHARPVLNRRAPAPCRSGAARAPARPRRSRPSWTRTSGRLGAGRSGASARATGGDEHRPQLRRGPQRTRLVAFVTTTRSATSSRPALIAGPRRPSRRLEHDGGIGGGGDLDLALVPCRPSRQDEAKPEASSTTAAAGRRRCQAARMDTRRHRADEHVASPALRLHPDAIPEERAAGDRGRRIDGHHGDRPDPPRGRSR